MKIGYLELIPKLKIDVVIPDEVYREAVIRGEEKGIADAIVIKRFINSYKLKVVNIESKYIKALRQRLNKVLTKGDEAVLSLAVKEKAKAIVTNDDGLGKIAMALGFCVNATPDLLIEGLRENVLDFPEFEALIRGLAVENRLSSVVGELYLLEGKKYVKS